MLLAIILSALGALAHADEEAETPLVHPATHEVIDPTAGQEDQAIARVPAFTIKGSTEQEQTDCKARLQAYLDRQACMNRYHVASQAASAVSAMPAGSLSALPASGVPPSGIRAEAFRTCGPDVMYPVDCPLQ